MLKCVKERRIGKPQETKYFHKKKNIEEKMIVEKVREGEKPSESKIHLQNIK